MGIAVLRDLLCCFFTSHPVFIVMHFFKICKGFLYFWPYVLKTVIIVNRRKTSCRTSSAACVYCVLSYIFCLKTRSFI